MRSLDRTPDGVGVHSEESVEGGVARDGPAEAGEAHLGPSTAGQGWGENIFQSGSHGLTAHGKRKPVINGQQAVSI